MPEQTFLAKNYDENAKKTDRDPRGAFKTPVENAAAGVVGPMGSSSFSLPNVERALTEMESGVGGASAGADAARKLASRANTRPSATGLAAQGPSTNARSQASSPTMPSTPTLAGPTQHEILQTFFQSLLSSKSSGAAAGKAAPAKTSSPDKGTEEGS